MHHTRILVVDDEPRATEIARRMLEPIGCEVREVNDPTLAFAVAREFRPALAILDYFMPMLHGGDLAWQFATEPEFAAMQIVLCSAFPDNLEKLQSLPRGIRTLAKPLRYATLLDLVGLQPTAAAA